MRWWGGSTVPGKQAAGVHVIHVICVIRPWDELSYMPSALEGVMETLLLPGASRALASSWAGAAERLTRYPGNCHRPWDRDSAMQVTFSPDGDRPHPAGKGSSPSGANGQIHTEEAPGRRQKERG